MCRPHCAANSPLGSGRAIRHNPNMEPTPVTLAFDQGTLLVGGPPALVEALPHVQPDPRTGGHRAEGRHYRALVEHLLREKIPYQDNARSYGATPWRLRASRDP